VAILLPRQASNNGTWALAAASAKLDAELRERLTPDCVVAESYAAATSSEARFDRTERGPYMSVNPSSSGSEQCVRFADRWIADYAI